MDNDFATGYALGSDSNGNCNNGFGGGAWEGIWGIIILAMVFGWGRGGFGFGGYGGGSDTPGVQGFRVPSLAPNQKALKPQWFRGFSL